MTGDARAGTVAVLLILSLSFFLAGLTDPAMQACH